MAVTIPEIFYTFNENSATVIRDYTENKDDATGSNLTVSATTRIVGKDAVFNGTSSELDASFSTVTDDITISMAIYLEAATGVDYIFSADGGNFYCYWTGAFLLFHIETDDGDSSWDVSTPLDTDTWYDIVLKLDNATGDMTITVDNVIVQNLAVTGTFSLTNPDIEIGHLGGGSHAKFRLNEFKILGVATTTAQQQAYIDEQNGVLFESELTNEFELGDIIGADIIGSVGFFAIVTFVDGNTAYRISPISDGLRTGMVFSRVGHLWDTTRQWMFVIDNTPQICFYDLISLSSEVGTDAKKTYCMGLAGLINPSVGKTDNYTLTNNDHTVFLTGSTAKTFTMPSSPTDNNEWLIVNLSTAVLTIAASSINGSSTQNLISKYDSAQIKYINSEFVIK